MPTSTPHSSPFWTALCLTFALTVGGCATPTHPQNLQAFIEFMEKAPDQIWASELSPKVKAALLAYRKHERVGPRHLEYGKSVRNLSLAGKTFEDLDAAITGMHCKKNEDVLKNPTTQKPSLDSAGHTIPMLVYLCPDGGVFRIKPQGDPTSRFRPEPHASKSLRFPYNSQFKSFDDEILKVDNQGRPVPKWAKDLNPMAQDSQRQKDFISGWADDAHTNLRMK